MKQFKIVTTSWDDGHRLDLKLAYLLQKFQIKGTFYIAPQNREINPQDRLQFNDIKSLGQNFEIGAHTMTHPLDLTCLDSSLVLEEINESKKNLENALQKKIKMFCYPCGRYNTQVKRLTKEAGFLGARTVKLFKTNYPVDFFEFGTTVHLYPKIRIYSNLKTALRNNLILTPTVFTDDWKKLLKRTFDYVNRYGGIWHLWGHSWEIEKFNLWDDLEEILIYISKRQGFSYLSNSETLKRKNF